MTLAPPMLALGFVLAAAAAGSGDYELVTVPPASKAICAKSLATCDAAIGAVRDFGLFADLRIVEMICVRHPNCFPDRAGYIDGFNMPMGLRR